MGQPMENAQDSELRELRKLIQDNATVTSDTRERVSALEANHRNMVRDCNEKWGTITAILQRHDVQYERIIQELKEISVKMATNSGKGILANHLITWGLALAAVLGAWVGASHLTLGGK